MQNIELLDGLWHFLALFVKASLIYHEVDAAVYEFQPQAILFCRTKLDCDNLERYLKTYEQQFPGQFTCVCLHGDRPPPQRKANLEAFKQNKVRFLICTDVAGEDLIQNDVRFSWK